VVRSVAAAAALLVRIRALDGALSTVGVLDNISRSRREFSPTAFDVPRVPGSRPAAEPGSRFTAFLEAVVID
jgi:hypothetical protein